MSGWGGPIYDGLMGDSNICFAGRLFLPPMLKEKGPQPTASKELSPANDNMSLALDSSPV